MPRTQDAIRLNDRTRIRIPSTVKATLRLLADKLGLPQPETERVVLALGARVLYRQVIGDQEDQA